MKSYKLGLVGVWKESPLHRSPRSKLAESLWSPTGSSQFCPGIDIPIADEGSGTGLNVASFQGQSLEATLPASTSTLLAEI